MVLRLWSSSEKYNSDPCALRVGVGEAALGPAAKTAHGMTESISWMLYDQRIGAESRPIPPLRGLGAATHLAFNGYATRP